MNTFKPQGKVVQTVKRAAIAFTTLAIMSSGCAGDSSSNKFQNSNEPGGKTNHPVQKTNPDSKKQQDKIAKAKLFGNVLAIVTPQNKAEQFYDGDPKISGSLKTISAKTLEGATLSEPQFDETTGMTTFQITPREAKGWLLVTITAGGIIAFSHMTN